MKLEFNLNQICIYKNVYQNIRGEFTIHNTYGIGTLWAVHENDPRKVLIKLPYIYTRVEEYKKVTIKL